MCAGITVYEALLAADAQARDRVGVVGLGGLGHLAVLYARAMGCAVTVFSGSGRKREDAVTLGADAFHVLNKEGTEPPAAGDVNVLLLCGGDITDMGLFLPLLARRARIVPVVIQMEPLSIPCVCFLLPPPPVGSNISSSRYMPFILPGHRLMYVSPSSPSLPSHFSTNLA